MRTHSKLKYPNKIVTNVTNRQTPVCLLNLHLTLLLLLKILFCHHTLDTENRSSCVKHQQDSSTRPLQFVKFPQIYQKYTEFTQTIGSKSIPMLVYNGFVFIRITRTTEKKSFSVQCITLNHTYDRLRIITNF